MEKIWHWKGAKKAGKGEAGERGSALQPDVAQPNRAATSSSEDANYSTSIFEQHLL
jgi:hypothetical protein